MKLYTRILIRFLGDVFSSEKSMSCKRFAGFLGWIVCLMISLYCTVKQVPSPDSIDYLFICSTSLIGLDSLVKGAEMFSRKK